MKYEIYYNGAQVYPYDPCEFDNREDAEYQLKCMIEVDGYKPGELEIVETHDDEKRAMHYKLYGDEILCYIEYEYSADGVDNHSEIAVENYSVPIDEVDGTAERYIEECKKTYAGDFTAEWWDELEDEISSDKVSVKAYDEDKCSWVEIDSKRAYRE